MSIDRTALRQLLHGWLDADLRTVYEMVPQLLDDLDTATTALAECRRSLSIAADGAVANRGRIAELETMVQRRDAQGQLAGDRITGLELRLSIATELNVGDRKLIDQMRAALTEAINWITDRSCPDSILVERLRKLVSSEET